MPSDADLEPDGGEPVGVSSEELYTVVHAAVKDALLDVLATLALLGFALVFLYAGATSLLEGSTGFEYVVGGATVGLGLAFAAAAFDLVPSFHEKLIG
ncbi:hypothetical protein [Halopiger goleimassiliensis]|uniref:hypothetical protein n=1 Tax=Halopiger goleimassiliensis TaxID=1293048 RepID=UPI0006781504|nr:hypothetical protein [Halopiger goleimassiliensis]